jgi:hypothetical protein
VTFPQTVLPLKTEILLADGPWTDGPWTDISTSVRGSQSNIAITRGRQNEASVADTMNVAMVLDNTTGDLCPTNPTGQYYGAIGRNTPIRTWLPGSLAGLTVPIKDGSIQFTPSPQLESWTAGTDIVGQVEAYASCPDSAALSITGNISLAVDAKLDDWGQPYSYVLQKYETSTNQRSYRLGVGLSTPGYVGFQWSTDGSNYTIVESTIPLPQPWDERKAVLVVFEVDSFGSHWANFFYAASFADADSGGGWVHLGDSISVAGATSIYDSTAPLLVGRWCYGTIYGARVYNGREDAGGTIVANPDFTAQTDGTTSFTDGHSNTFTLTNAAIEKKNIRFTGEVAAWPMSWDKTGKNVYASVTAAGVLRRLNNDNSPVNSPFRNTLVEQTSNLIEYWPCEDPTGSTQVSSAMGGAPLTFTGSPTLATDSAFACSKPLPQMGTSVYHAPCRGIGNYSNGGYSPGNVAARMLVDFPSGGSPDQTRLMRLGTTGVVAYWDLIYTTGGGLTLKGYNSTGTLLFTDGPTAFAVDGFKMWLGFELVQSGSTLTATVVTLHVGDTLGGIAVGTATLAGAVGDPTYIQINGDTAHAGTEIGFGHVTVHNGISSIFDLWEPLNSWVGETAGARIARVCDENGISCSIKGGAVSSAPMGAQPIGTVLSILRECEAADGGVLYEPREFVSVAYRTALSIGANAELGLNAATTLTYSAKDLSSILPTYDDLQSANDLTVSRQAGSSAEATLTSGAMSIQRPPNGLGRIARASTVNVKVDGQLPDVAHWLLNLGTYPLGRVPQIGIELSRSNYAGSATLTAAASGLDVGDLLTITGMTQSGFPPDDLVLLTLGFSEVLSNFQWDITYNCSPGQPWQLGVYSDTASRYDTESTALDVAVNSTATSFPVTSSGTRWTDDAGDYPFDLMVDGERVTATAVAYTNLIPNGTFDTDTFDWWGNGGTITRDTSIKHSGTGSLKFTTGSGVDPAAESGAYGGLLPCRPGEAIGVSMWLRADTSRTLGLDVNWYDSGGGFLDYTRGSGGIAAATWTFYEFPATALPIAPAGAYYFDVDAVNVGTPGSGRVMWVDDVTVTNEFHQTFTVTRQVNGVSKAHVDGVAVSLFHPVRHGVRT